MLSPHISPPNNWEEQKDCTACGVESLEIGTILEDFHSAGSWPVLIERLKRKAREGVISTAKVFSIQAEMLSGPVAECF